MTSAGGERSVGRGVNVFLALSAVSDFGSRAVMLVLPVLAYDRTKDPASAGFVAASLFLGTVVSSGFAGALVDRGMARRWGVISSAMQALTSIVVVVLIVARWDSVAALCVAGLLYAASAVVGQAAESVTIKTLVDPAILGAVLARNEIRFAAAGILGPLLGGLLYAVSDTAVFLIDAASFVALGVAFWKTALNMPVGERRAVSAFSRSALAGFTFVRRHRNIALLAAGAAVSSFAMQCVLFALIVGSRMDNQPKATVATFEIAISVGVIIGSVFAGRLIASLRVGAVLVVSEVAALIGYVAIVWSSDVAVVYPALVLSGLFSASASAAVGAYIMNETPQRLQGRVVTALTMVNTLLQPLAALLAGWVMSSHGVPWVVAIACASIAAVLSLLLASRSIRSLPRATELSDGA